LLLSNIAVFAQFLDRRFVTVNFVGWFWLEPLLTVCGYVLPEKLQK